MTDFQKKVYVLTKKIPQGKVSTYKQIAKAINYPQASRAVGNALNANPFAPKIPCHRVVKSDGCIGGFAGGKLKKITLLKEEGIKIKKDKIVDFQKKMHFFLAKN